MSLSLPFVDVQILQGRDLSALQTRVRDLLPISSSVLAFVVYIRVHLPPPLSLYYLSNLQKMFSFNAYCMPDPSLSARDMSMKKEGQNIACLVLSLVLTIIETDIEVAELLFISKQEL